MSQAVIQTDAAAGAAGTLAATPTVLHPSVLVDKAAVRAYIVAGISYFFVSLLAGALYSLQFLQAYPFPGVELMSPGRIRMLHTNSVAYGFLVNVFFGCLHWVIPRLTGSPVLSKKISWFVFFAWQAITFAAFAGIVGGEGQAVEWGETPTWIDPVVLVGAAVAIVNFAWPILKSGAGAGRGASGKSMYVTLWYYSAAFVWLALVYFMGNFIPQYWVPGAAGAATVGIFIHDLVGLFVTPMGWGLMYYLVPVITKKPIWSHSLSVIGFWGLAFFYPLNGIHHFFYSPIPMYAQYGAVISTIAVEIVVFTVIVNFFMSLRGRGDLLRSNLSLRWLYTGMVFYFTTCLQCAFHTTLTLQKIIHFTDWVVGHAHLVMFGVFGFWLFGAIHYLWPRVTGRQWVSPKLNAWHYWVNTLALLVMFVDLLAAGVVQGWLWSTLAPWEQSLIASVPFWWVRSIAGIAIVAAQAILAYHMWITARSGAALEERTAAASPVVARVGAEGES
ncbi:MAG: cbb3-type cytochrome c oxidase subunit I [Deltaproteobacteria bacterium]|nr:cbb3-type cytochrome c oxidase subunit I [Deltaproteobacteria bacterium]